jgi:F0F1-type ATP synthase membrane subunit c/vacuolar-type H+-ATPase subunit K
MMVSVTRTPMRWITALARKIGLDANPLRRRSDRAEAWIRLGLVLIFLAASPLAAVGLGNLTNAASMSAARAQAASERQVPAVLVKKVSRATDNPLYGSSQLVWARAQWTAPDGQRRTGEVPAPVGSQAGHKEIIWVDSSGQLVYPPIGQGQIASRVIAVVALTPAALGALLMITLWLIRRFLDRRRITNWAAEWSAVEPQWTKRLH